jgi:hypothetical protein
MGKPTLTDRPDWLENHEQPVRGSGDRKQTAGRAKRDRKRTAAVREWMRDNHGYG